jgi:cytochrome c6
MKRIYPIAAMLVLALLCMISKPAMADDAADLYKSKCQACHGPDGKGDTTMGKKLGVRDFHSPEVSKQSDADLFKITKEGKNKMPSYNGKLTDDQIKALVKYIHSLK